MLSMIPAHTSNPSSGTSRCLTVSSHRFRAQSMDTSQITSMHLLPACSREHCGGWFPAGPFIVATNSAGQVGFRVEVTLPLNKSGFATRRCEVKFILDPED